MFLIIVLFIVVILYVWYNPDTYDHVETYLTRKPACNNVDQRCYEVVGKYDNHEEASEILGKLNNFCLALMKHLRNKYVWSDHPNKHATEIVKFLMSNYNPDGIIENAPTNDINTSYVDDKGQVFAICLREKITGTHQFHDMHDLEFVVIHELTHMATKSFGHGRDFWTHFKFLLAEAKEAGLHTPRKYQNDPINYCSLTVDYNPYFDDRLRDIM